MSSSTTKLCCVACRKESTILKCETCWQIGYNDQTTNKPSNEGKINQGISTEEEVKVQRQAVIQQVNDWQCEAMNQIRQIGDEIRNLIPEYESDHISQMVANLSKVTDQLRQCHEENRSIAQNLIQEHNELSTLSKASDQKDVASTTEEHEIRNDALLFIPNIPANAKWMPNGVTVAGGNGKGSRLNQLPTPRNIYVNNDDQTIYVVDQMNHRVMSWKSGATSGQVLAGGNGRGNRSNQLTYPAAAILHKGNDSLIICTLGKVMQWPLRNNTTGETIVSNVNSFGMAIDTYGYLYICEFDKCTVTRRKIGDEDGTVVAGGNGNGSRLDQLDEPVHIFIDRDRSLYISDGRNHRVVKWIKGAKEGIVVAGGHGQGNALTQLAYPRGVVVDQLGTVYVADYTNNRIMRWTHGATEGSVVVGDYGKGAEPNQLNGCWDLAFDAQGNLLVSDSNNQRVQKFNINPESIQ